MEIRVLYVDGCPNAELARSRVLEAVAGRPDVTVAMQQVESATDAEHAGMQGSPTILVDGINPFASPTETPSWACRLFRSPDGDVSGAPSPAQLRAVLTNR